MRIDAFWFWTISLQKPFQQVKAYLVSKLKPLTAIGLCPLTPETLVTAREKDESCVVTAVCTGGW